MDTYNKIIIAVWWFIAIGSAVTVTIMGFIQGFDRWVEYYMLTVLSFFILFLRRYLSRKVYNKQQKEN